MTRGNYEPVKISVTGISRINRNKMATHTLEVHIIVQLFNSTS